jgi:small subunit ribosomal protein S4
MLPSWLTMDNANLVGRVVAMPAREDIDLTIEEHLIVEYYSK